MKLKDKNLFLNQLTESLDKNIGKNKLTLDEIESHLKEYIKTKKERIENNRVKPKRKRTKKIVRPALFISDSSDDSFEMVELN
tara:strand:+ start:215 stop:463 length:249 start_codon:yes stop_codon:yes gene_type:complete